MEPSPQAAVYVYSTGPYADQKSFMPCQRKATCAAQLQLSAAMHLHLIGVFPLQKFLVNTRGRNLTGTYCHCRVGPLGDVTSFNHASRNSQSKLCFYNNENKNGGVKHWRSRDSWRVFGLCFCVSCNTMNEGRRHLKDAVVFSGVY